MSISVIGVLYDSFSVCIVVGSKKTVWMNIADICQAINRSMDHCASFFGAELNAAYSFDGESRLILNGRFQPKVLLLHYPLYLLLLSDVLGDDMIGD